MFFEREIDTETALPFVVREKLFSFTLPVLSSLLNEITKEALTETLVALSSGMVEITIKSLAGETALPPSAYSSDESLLQEGGIRIISNNPVNNFHVQFDIATFPDLADFVQPPTSRKLAETIKRCKVN
jgi:hypothetical protein